MIENITLINGDCLEEMPKIQEQVDMILCDLPYGTTACSWDTIIPFELLWEQYKRLIKPNGAIVLFGSQPFTSALVMSNPKWFKYEWIWEKEQGVNFLNKDHVPLKNHENILVFGGGKTPYNPQMTKGTPFKSGLGKSNGVYGMIEKISVENIGTRYPKSVVFCCRETGLHPTQKPVELCEYLIRTYTNGGELVLDNCMGSGTTALACLQTHRRCIGIEKDQTYFKVAQDRIAGAQLSLL